jgi:pimeloyl-ACP methyl ester carboxylesterase
MTRARQEFIDAQRRMLDRYEIEAQSRFVDVPLVEGRAHVLVSGEGPSVVMLNGIGTPGAMWAPLMAELDGLQLLVVDLPGYGLTDTTDRFTHDLRHNAVRFLEGVLDVLGLRQPAFVTNSLGSLWASWLALDLPDRVARMVQVGCPALVLGTSCPLPMRILSARPLGRLLTWLQPPSPAQVEQLSRMVKEHPLVPELADLLLATERLPRFRSTLLSTLHALLRLRGSRPEMRLTTGQLARIRQRALLFWGRDDPFGSPAVGAQMAASMPSAELHVVAGGHTPWLGQAKHIGPVASAFLQEREVASQEPTR